jgi:hypothetical protein
MWDQFTRNGTRFDRTVCEKGSIEEIAHGIAIVFYSIIQKKMTASQNSQN